MLRNRERLIDLGVSFSIFYDRWDEIHDCDLLILDSRYFSKLWNIYGDDEIIKRIEELKNKIKAVLFFDISDSTGWIQSQVIPHVTAYYKSQLLKDKNQYLKNHYGNRIYTDYYHKKFGIHDEIQAINRKIENKNDLNKLNVSWNSGLANYSYLGPYLNSLYRYLPLKNFLRYPTKFHHNNIQRTIDVSCRMGIKYSRKTVCYQREQIRKKLSSLLRTNKISRQKYLTELENSKIVVSPFGFGEITLKDFETFLSGAILLKPDMSHMETYPNFYNDEEELGCKTISTHKWDLSDLEFVIDSVLNDYNSWCEVGKNGQERYHYYIADRDGYEEFCLYFRDIIIKHISWKSSDEKKLKSSYANWIISSRSRWSRSWIT